MKQSHGFKVEETPEWYEVRGVTGAVISAKLLFSDDEAASIRARAVRATLVLDSQNALVQFKHAETSLRTYDDQIVKEISGYNGYNLSDVSQFLVRGDRGDYKSLGWVNNMSFGRILDGSDSYLSYHMLNEQVLTVALMDGIQYQDHYSEIRGSYNTGLAIIKGKHKVLRETPDQFEEVLVKSIHSAKSEGRFAYIQKVLGLSDENIDYLLNTIRCEYNG